MQMRKRKKKKEEEEEEEEEEVEEEEEEEEEEQHQILSLVSDTMAKGHCIISLLVSCKKLQWSARVFERMP